MYTLFIDTHAANTLLILYKDNNLYKIKEYSKNLALCIVYMI